MAIADFATPALALLIIALLTLAALDIVAAARRTILPFSPRMGGEGARRADEGLLSLNERRAAREVASPSSGAPRHLLPLTGPQAARRGRREEGAAP